MGRVHVYLFVFQYLFEVHIMKNMLIFYTKHLFRVIKEKLIHLSNLTRSTTAKDVNEYIENSCDPEYFKTKKNLGNQTSQSNQDEIM